MAGAQYAPAGFIFCALLLLSGGLSGVRWTTPVSAQYNKNKKREELP